MNYVCLSCDVTFEYEPPSGTPKMCSDAECAWPGCGYEWPVMLACPDCEKECAVPEAEADFERKAVRELREQL